MLPKKRVAWPVGHWPVKWALHLASGDAEPSGREGCLSSRVELRVATDLNVAESAIPCGVVHNAESAMSSPHLRIHDVHSVGDTASIGRSQRERRRVYGDVFLSCEGQERTMDAPGTHS